MVSDAQIIGRRYLNAVVPSSMASCISLEPMVPILPGAGRSFIVLPPLLHLLLGTFLKLRRMTLACCVGFPVEACVTFMTAAFLTPMSILCDRAIMVIFQRRAKPIFHLARLIGVVMGCSPSHWIRTIHSGPRPKVRSPLNAATLNWCCLPRDLWSRDIKILGRYYCSTAAVDRNMMRRVTTIRRNMASWHSAHISHLMLFLHMAPMRRTR